MDKIGFKSFVADGSYANDSTSYKGTEPENDNGPATPEEIGNDILGLFGEPSTSESGSTPDPFDLYVSPSATPGESIDPLTGETVGTPETNPYYVKTIEEILLKAKEKGIVLKPADLEEIMKLYEANRERFLIDTASIEKAMAIGSTYFGDPAMDQKFLKAINTGLEIIDEAINSIPGYIEEIKATYKKECEEFKKIATADPNFIKEFNEATTEERSALVEKLQAADLDCNDYIGDEYLKIVEGTSFGTVIYDCTNNKYVSRLSADGSVGTEKWFDAEYEWNPYAPNGVDDDVKPTSTGMTLEAFGDSPTCSDNYGGAKFNIFIPDYVKVKIDKDGEIKTKLVDGENHAYASTKQNEAGEEEGYCQVRVGPVEVVTEESDSGTTVDHIIRFYDKTEDIVLYEIRITDGAKYTLALNGLNRKEPTIIDASQMYSLCKFEVGYQEEEDIKTKYGIDLDQLDEDKANPKKEKIATEAFDDTMAHFNAKDGQAPVEKGDPEAAGIIAYGIYGYVQGSTKGNNLVCFEDPAKSDQVMEGDTGTNEDINPFFNNVFVAGDKHHNAVFAKGDGNLYASNVTLAFNESDNKDAINQISVNSYFTPYDKTDEKTNDQNEGDDGHDFVNNKVFVHLGGNVASKTIQNKLDTDTLNKNAKKEMIETADDDYFFTDGDGAYTAPAITDEAGGILDPDADSGELISDSEGGFLNKSKMKEKGDEIAEKMADWSDTLDDPYSELASDLDFELNGEKYTQNKEMLDGFFGEVAMELGVEGTYESPNGDGGEEEKI